MLVPTVGHRRKQGFTSVRKHFFRIEIGDELAIWALVYTVFELATAVEFSNYKQGTKASPDR